jgi:hypothetical protein
MPKDWLEVPPHADMAAHQSKQEKGRHLLPQSRGRRCVNPVTPAIWTISKAYFAHVRLDRPVCAHLDAFGRSRALKRKK